MCETSVRVITESDDFLRTKECGNNVLLIICIFHQKYMVVVDAWQLYSETTRHHSIVKMHVII